MNKPDEEISYHCAKCKAKCSPPEPGSDYVVCPICNRQTMSAFALRTTAHKTPEKS